MYKYLKSMTTPQTLKIKCKLKINPVSLGPEYVK